MANKRNDPVESEVTENTNFELEVSMKRRLEQIADETERSLSGMLRLIVKQYLDDKGNLSETP